MRRAAAEPGPAPEAQRPTGAPSSDAGLGRKRLTGVAWNRWELAWVLEQLGILPFEVVREGKPRDWGGFPGARESFALVRFRASNGINHKKVIYVPPFRSDKQLGWTKLNL